VTDTIASAPDFRHYQWRRIWRNLLVGWLDRKIGKWASGKQKKELGEFLNRLRAMDGEELGLVVACATDRRHLLEAQGHMVSDPIVYVAENPQFLAQLSQVTVEYQRQGRLVLAAAMMVWVHTLRAGLQGELRPYGRDMWRELQRGFPYVEEAAVHAAVDLKLILDTTGFDDVPKGLTLGLS